MGRGNGIWNPSGEGGLGGSEGIVLSASGNSNEDGGGGNGGKTRCLKQVVFLQMEGRHLSGALA